MYRSTGDIFDKYESFKDIALSQIDHLCCSAPGCYNDMDMLTVGMYGKGLVGSEGCNDAEYRSQFSLWCLFSSPLMLGCDIRHMTPETKALITNKNLIRINQDSEARPPIAYQYPWYEDRKVFMKHLSNGEYAFGFFNLTDNCADVPLLFEEIGLPSFEGYGFELTDVFTGENIGVQKEIMHPLIDKHDCKVYLAKLVEA